MSLSSRFVPSVVAGSLCLGLAACDQIKIVDPGTKASGPAEPAASATAGPLSCTKPTGSICWDLLTGDGNSFKAKCDGSVHGKLATTPCPTAQKLGTCEQVVGNDHERLTYYPGGEDALTKPTAKQHCDAIGDGWKP